MDFSNKKALVTGAGKGIGRAIAKSLIHSGAETYALSRTQEDLDSLQKECPSVKTICVDLADWDATRKAVEKIGQVDLLVNNAGISTPEAFLDVKPQNVDKMFAVNVKSVIAVSQVVVKGMIDSGKGGSIVNMSSQASKVALPEHTVYCATKGALDQITRVMAVELGPKRIRVNAVNPTICMTPMGEKVWSEPVKKDPALARIPMGRFAEMEDIVGPTLFLLSDNAAMITGTTTFVDGGWTAA